MNSNFIVTMRGKSGLTGGNPSSGAVGSAGGRYRTLQSLGHCAPCTTAKPCNSPCVPLPKPKPKPRPKPVAPKPKPVAPRPRPMPRPIPPPYR